MIGEILVNNYIPPTMNGVRTAEKEKSFSVVSLFAGCGGSSTGYRLAGGNILAVNEFMEAARNIYSKNYPHTYIFPQDIRKLSGQDILSKIGLNVGELDVLDGSPPCAAFSQSGLVDESWGKVKKYSKTQQRVDDLFYEYSRILEEIQPKVFVAENVKGLTAAKSKHVLGAKSKSLKNFFSFEQETLTNGMDETIAETLRKCGYRVSYKVLDASHFGVPQKRERLIFIGVRNDLHIKPSFPREFTRNSHIMGKEALADLLFNGSEAELKTDSKNYWYIKNFIKSHTSRADIVKIKRQNNLKLFEQRFNRANWNSLHLTILQADFANVFHSVVDRYMSVDEARRIQSFPEDFDFLTKGKERFLVSIDDIENNEFNYVNHQAGHNSGDLKQICAFAGLSYDDIKKEKIFNIDLKSIDFDEKDYRKKSASSWEFIGRAVPPLLMKSIASHIRDNILRKV